MSEKDSIHAGHRERIRQRFREQGLTGFAEHEVLELLLTYAISRKDVNPLAHELLAQFGSLAAVLEADESELLRVKGVGENTASLIALMPELFGVYRRSAMGERPRVTNYAEAKAYCQSLFFGAHEEMVYVLCLDQGGRVIHPALLRRGTVNEVTIYPRDVVETVIRYRAHAVMITHNHPSGTCRPSQADIDVTTRISMALSAIGVSMIDHLILSGDEVYSMKRELSGLRSAGGQNAEAAGGGLREDLPHEPTLDELLLAGSEGGSA